MGTKEIFDAFKLYNNSWRSYTSKGGVVTWTDWNQVKHTAVTEEELRSQLAKAPQVQTKSLKGVKKHD